jgi:hypothetical protein
MFLGGCAQKAAWEHYDECAVETSSFQAMVACGKQKRTAYCQAESNCTADGNAVVMYADSLNQSVTNKEMTEAEAARRWIEFRTARADTQRQLAAQAAAARAASGPKTCVQTENVVNCF